MNDNIDNRRNALYISNKLIYVSIYVSYVMKWTSRKSFSIEIFLERNVPMAFKRKLNIGSKYKKIILFFHYFKSLFIFRCNHNISNLF